MHLPVFYLCSLLLDPCNFREDGPRGMIFVERERTYYASEDVCKEHVRSLSEQVTDQKFLEQVSKHFPPPWRSFGECRNWILDEVIMFNSSVQTLPSPDDTTRIK